MLARHAYEKQSRRILFPQSMAVARALFTLLFLAYPQIAAAGLILDDDASQPAAHFRRPFLFQLLIPPSDLTIDACNLTGLHAGANARSTDGDVAGTRVGQRAETGQMVVTSAGGLLRRAESAPWLVPRSRMSGSEWMFDTANSVGPGAAGIAALGLIKTRLASFENCRRFLQYLLKTINEVVLGLTEERTGYGLGQNLGGTQVDQVDFVFKETARPLPGKPEPTDVSLPYFSTYKAQNTRAAALNIHRSKLTINKSVGSKSAPGPERKKAPRSRGNKITVKQFIKEILSHTYTHVFIAIILIITIFSRFRLQ